MTTHNEDNQCQSYLTKPLIASKENLLVANTSFFFKYVCRKQVSFIKAHNFNC